MQKPLSKWTQAMRFPAVVLPRIFDAHKAIVGLLYLPAYVVLDWVSFIEPYAPFGITPWNPNTGLSFVLVLLFGPEMIPFLFLGQFLADLVNRPIVLPWTVEFISVALIGSGYSGAL